jgi:hypothetical protein
VRGKSAVNTPRGTLEASPSSVAFVVGSRYFFFAAFFAAFFAGFLAAFFVAICLFSLSMGCIDSCINKMQLKKCIDSSITSVKEKTNRWWKKQQQFSPKKIDGSTLSFKSSDAL